MSKQLEDLIFRSLIMLIGEEGIDWRFYVVDPRYWRAKVYLDRN